ncbi:30S ribosomal protein S25e [Aeropyrum camini]|uniref:30S ribosomal protein S25 n=1 Tax=Aeropyrum camini SY1 = JCM 12091 TaxID=1198449 RepID=U3TG95_9CREN|nr:30S ribosomal protein S25e [Aeropyrum camini]BAN91023.1 30S ribosomal protein S25 [Aeropyrum camini SY1 = JCM 12091]
MAKRKAQTAKEGEKQQGFKEIIPEVTEKLVAQARREVEREKWVTPHKLAQKMGIKVSIARRVLRILEEEGVLVLFTRNRRSPLYLPKKRVPTAPPRGL